MCGICGIWHQPDLEIVNAMVARMHHRGPDSSGTFSDQNVSIGMSRLAVIDLNPTGHQPMANPEETIWIVLNGEIYNFREERQHLESLGYRFVSTSDTEVVLRLYEHYGDDFLHRLRGMFALAIYDRRNGTENPRLLLARDQLGIKPLLYAQFGQQIIFASEIKALLASGIVSPQIDPQALRMLLSHGSVYQPRTILSDVKMLLPAHRMIVKKDRIRIEHYWSLDTNRHTQIRGLPYEEQTRQLRSALIKSVRRQMISDVPLGAFLSGGVDSSILVALMARETNHRVKTFSVGFEQEGVAIDESSAARHTADFLGTDHTHVLVRGQDVCEHILKIAAGLDQPSVDGVNAYFVSMAARHGVTVAISGTGGDEFFAGYPWFKNMADLYENSLISLVDMAGVPSRLPIFDFLISTQGGRWLQALRSRSGFLNRYAAQYQIFGPVRAARVLNPELWHTAQVGGAASLEFGLIDELEHGTVLERVVGLCLRGYTTNQLLRDIDAASMSHSLEVRVPYLDIDIADLSLSLPDHAKYHPDFSAQSNGSQSYRSQGIKRILLDIGQTLLPEGFDNRPKTGFAMPFASWLKGPLRELFMDTLSEESVRRRNLLNCAEVSKVKEQFHAEKLSWTEPWLIMMLELWCRQVLDG